MQLPIRYTASNLLNLQRFNFSDVNNVRNDCGKTLEISQGNPLIFQLKHLVENHSLLHFYYQDKLQIQRNKLIN